MEKPFVFGVPVKGAYFTDRKKETKQLKANFEYGINTILISPRRWGKTSLVEKAIGQISDKKVKVVFIDIFSCRNEQSFFQTFVTEVIKQTSSKMEEWLRTGREFLSHLVPRFQFGPDPMNDFTITLQYDARSSDVDAMLNLPEKIANQKGCRIVVCLDEFQQISEFADSLAFQKKLRSVWQHHQLTSYCMFGSKRHMMEQLFDSPSKPFYKFGDLINLGKIPTAEWVPYIKHQFSQYGKSIDEDLCRTICEKADDNSSYVQQLAWLTFNFTEGAATAESVDEAYETLMQQNNPLFEKVTEDLSTYQLNFLRALVDGVKEGYYQKETIDRYQLGSSANVKVVIEALLKKEIIYREGGVFYFCDPILPKWLKEKL